MQCGGIGTDRNLFVQFVLEIILEDANDAGQLETREDDLCFGAEPRALRSKGGRIPPDGARFILNLGITAADKKRTLKLLERQREGKANAGEREELESYVQADNLLSILKAQAILELDKAGQEP